MTPSEFAQEYPDSGCVERDAVEDWSTAQLRVTGTNDEIDGDGITVPLENLCPDDSAVVELIVDDEVVYRLTQNS